LAEASLLPDSYRKQPANIMVAMELAEALQIPLIQAINGVSVIKGKPTMSAELMRALVLRAGHRFKVETATDEGCRVLVARREWPDDVSEFVFTMKDAQRAGLASGDQYKKHPKAMLLARATSQACRAVFPDVIAGVSYTPDELDAPSAGRLQVPRVPVDGPFDGPIRVSAEIVDEHTGEVRQDELGE
jgi:hypothetical protein